MAQILKQSHIEGGGKKHMLGTTYFFQDIYSQIFLSRLQNGKGLTGLRKYIHNQDFYSFLIQTLGVILENKLPNFNNLAKLSTN